MQGVNGAAPVDLSPILQEIGCCWEIWEIGPKFRKKRENDFLVAF
jgi:hypothetical protein